MILLQGLGSKGQVDGIYVIFGISAFLILIAIIGFIVFIVFQ